jgi:signal transduction histidine kinase
MEPEVPPNAMLPPDVRSTLLFSGMIDAVFAVAIILLWRRDRHQYLRAWSAGYGALALAQVLVAGRGYVPDLVSIIVGNGMVVLGNALLYFGTSMFYARRAGTWAVAAIFVGTMAGFVYFTYAVPNINTRTLLISVAQLALLSMHLAQFYGPSWRVQWSGSALAMFFIGLYGCAMIGRCVWVLTSPETANFFAATNSQTAALLVQALSGVGIGLGLCNLHAVTLIDGARLSERRLAEANQSLTQLTVRLELRNTEYAQARDYAEAASRSKSQFLANMSHELRTPLNAIIGFSEMIRDTMLGPIGTAGYRDYAADINRSGLHLLQLVTDILDMSKAEAGHLALNEEICDPARVIDSSVSMVRDTARNAQVMLQVASMDDTPWLFADERRLRQVLINLLSNAIKFTLPGGRISVALAVDAEGLLAFEVEDSGIGMSEAHIEIALTPFGQVDSRLNRKYEGAGLGLPLTRQLLELHDGELDIASELGRGTRVTARFPAYRIRPRLM